MSLVEQTKDTLKSYSRPRNDRYLLAVSGGKDSMVMLDVFHKLGVQFSVAHMNYGLRDEASDLDQALVQKICNNLGVNCYVKKVDTQAFCEKEKISTQEGARILRYFWFNELMEENDLNWVVTAHHEEDNKETFLQNLKRGSGLRGLKAMLPIHENKLKPLIRVSRSEIDNYCNSNHISYRQDASNNQLHYQRNLIRNKVLPQLEKDLMGIGKGISTTIENLQLDYDYLIHQLEREADKNLVKDGDEWRILSFRKLHPRLLFHLLEKFGFNKKQVEDLIHSKSSGKKVENAQFIAQDGHGDLLIFRDAGNVSTELEIREVGSYHLQGVNIVISESVVPDEFERNRQVAFMDADKITWPLLVRNYQHGDKIKPIGMVGKKKLSDYFTDAKIPVHRRSQIKVVISEGEIAWVVGEITGDNFKITGSTKKVLKFETF